MVMIKLFYFLFIAAITFGGTIHIGPLTPRQYVAIVIFMFCSFNIKKLYSYLNKYIVLYFLFILFWFGCSVINGELDFFVREFISKYLVAITCYLFTILLYIKTKSLRVLMFSLLICGGINSIVCMLQYINNPIGIALGALFTDLEDPLVITNFNLMGEEGAYLFGLLGNPVLNGHFSMILPFVPLFFYKEEECSDLLKSVMILSSIYFLVVVFCIQQRSCFIIDILVFFAYFLFSSDKVGKKVPIFILILFMALFSMFLWGDQIMDAFSSSRFSNSGSDDLRVSIYTDAIHYIGEHPFTGGIRTYYNIYERYPHNIILSAFIYSGLVGGLALLFLYYKQIQYAWKLMLSNINISASMMFLALSLNGLLHNNSIVTGDAHVWILWGAVISCGYIIKKNNAKNICHHSSI